MQLHRARDRFDAAGVDLVLIGQAGSRQAAHFRGKLELDPLPVLADEDRATYRIAGFKRGGVSQLLGAKSVLSGVKHAARSGVVQGRPVGDVAQLGGVAVIAPGGEVVFEQASKNAGDTIEPDDLLAAATVAR